ncbi:MAG: serine hydrolase [Candidatus Rokuibacteriota bacterium]|nr:MAG: serine hydrolase [Candidatus Rokubacteria bacterium]
MGLLRPRRHRRGVSDGRRGDRARVNVSAPGDWPTAKPEDAGLDPRRLDDAIAYHRAHETRWRRDFLLDDGCFIGVADEPQSAGGVLGPVRPRGGPSGLVVRDGRVVADWGDTERVEMSFSIAKSYLAALAGVAVAHGLIETIDDPVRDYATDNAFASEQNRAITWRHLLQQTSEWSGTLFGKPDSIDHNRDLGKADFGQTDKGVPRPMRPPGTLWEYNDVRVNRLSLSLLQLFRSPLADVLRDAIMAPIGASSTWEWRPYANAWVEIDGRQMPSVPGGSHWGGGLWMSARDHARFGLLHLRRGRWGDAQILPASWIDECRQPCAINPEYGLLWWLDVGRTGAWAARGAGSSLVWIDPDDDLVAVVRWVDKPHIGGFLERLLDAVER